MIKLLGHQGGLENNGADTYFRINLTTGDTNRNPNQTRFRHESPNPTEVIMNNHTKNILSITVIFVFLMMGLCPPVTGEGESRSSVKETPKISSSLAKNLWRQAHFYFEERLNPQAIRACEELLAWAQENNEPEIETEMNDMLAILYAKEQTSQPTEVPRKE